MTMGLFLISSFQVSSTPLLKSPFTPHRTSVRFVVILNFASDLSEIRKF